MTDRPFDRIADAFLAPGPVVLSDRVLDAAFEEVHLTRRRRVLWRAPWRVPIMNTSAKIAVAAVAVIAVGFLGMTFLGADESGVGVAPSVAPSATTAPTATPASSASPLAGTPPLTGEFTSPTHGYAISYPEGWSTRPATAPWTTGVVDYFNEGADLLMPGDPGDPGNPFLALASQPLGDRTREQWEADVWQILIDDDPETAACQSAAEPITIDDASGIRGCDNVLVTDGGRGYLVMLWVSGEGPGPGEYDQEWYRSVLATMELHPEDAIDTAP